jgi:lipoprotein-anchoring transpeptidase ErfK/SrfK
VPAPVRIYTRYRGGRSRSRSPDPQSWLYVLLCLSLAALLGWVWWRHVEAGRAVRSAGEVATNAAARATSTPPVAPTNRLPPEPKKEVAHAAPTNQAPAEPASQGRPVKDIFEAQVAMAREVISSGSIDGALGSQTRAALRAFQRKHGLAPTGVLDGDTRARMLVAPPLHLTCTVESNDLQRLLPLSHTWLGKSEQPRLDYETVLELLAERAFAHPLLLHQLNPQIRWESVAPGTLVTIPNVQYPLPPAKAAFLRISLSEKTLEAFDAGTNLLAHFPCSIGKLAEKRPVGELHVVVAAPDPNYTFNPEVFPESEEGRQLGRKLILPPGPNNPVGTAWIGLDRPGYGMHGTPLPELVGRTESHGCFRLANWNAEYLLKLVAVGTPVRVEP